MALNWNKEFLRDKKKGKFHTVKNDKNEKIPSHCDKCGGEVHCYFQGEPIYKCEKCGKYFGTVPFKNETKKIIINQNQFNLLKEEVVSDGNSSHNPYAKKWKNERKTLIDFLVSNGTLMTNKENGKKYFTYYDKMISSYLGINYALCVQYNEKKLEPGSIVYIYALDKFTPQLFQAKFDTRGRDNLEGTADDLQ